MRKYISNEFSADIINPIDRNVVLGDYSSHLYGNDSSRSAPSTRNHFAESIEEWNRCRGQNILRVCSSNRENPLDDLRHPLDVKTLWLSGNRQCITLKVAARCANIINLTFTNGNSPKLTGLGKLRMMTTLNITHNNLTSLRGLRYARTVKELHVCGNKITTLEELSHLCCLTKISAKNCDLTSLHGLETLSKLIAVITNDNNITSLDGVPQNAALSCINILRNRLTSLKALERVPKLRSLNVSGNMLTSLDGLQNAISMTHIYVSNNQLTSFECIPKEGNYIRTIDAGKNKLTSLSGLENFIEPMKFKPSSIRTFNLITDRCQYLTIPGLDKRFMDNDFLCWKAKCMMYAIRVIIVDITIVFYMAPPHVILKIVNGLPQTVNWTNKSKIDLIVAVSKQCKSIRISNINKTQ